MRQKSLKVIFMAKYKKKLEHDIRCPLEYGLTIFGGKWKSPDRKRKISCTYFAEYLSVV